MFNLGVGKRLGDGTAIRIGLLESRLEPDEGASLCCVSEKYLLDFDLLLREQRCQPLLFGDCELQVLPESVSGLKNDRVFLQRGFQPALRRHIAQRQEHRGNSVRMTGKRDSLK